jgi:hypothetical protein
MADVCQIVKVMREQVLTGPDRWVKGSFAETATGWSVVSSSPEAVRWCLFGAYKKARAITGLNIGVDPFCALFAEHVGHDAIAAWNDSSERKFEDVTALLDTMLANPPCKEAQNG